jgi:integrase
VLSVSASSPSKALRLAHLGAFPPLGAGFVFVTVAGNPIRRTAFRDVWRAAVMAAGAPAGTGFHQLRHFYASLLIRHGESVKTVQARLGHASASETLDTYSHLWPDSDDRTRTAVDSVLLRTLCGLRRWSMDIIPSQMLIGGRVGR